MNLPNKPLFYSTTTTLSTNLNHRPLPDFLFLVQDLNSELVKHIEPCFAGDMLLTRTFTFDNDNWYIMISQT